MTADNSEGRETLLIVDDEPLNIRLLAEVLQTDYRLLVATSGEEGLAIARDNRVDLILLDIIMPGMGGYAVVEALKADASTATIPVMFISGMDQEYDETRGLDAGAVDYITKPPKPAILRARVRTHLRLRKAQEELSRKNALLEETADLREHVDRINRHDLKSPLNVIIGFPSVLLDAGKLTQEQAFLIKQIEEAGYRMLSMINRTLDLYKMERGEYVPRMEKVDLAGVMQMVMQEIAMLVKSRSLKILFRTNGVESVRLEPFMVMGEELLLYSLFSNLMKNAVEASPRGYQIEVSMDRHGPVSTLTIHNDGMVPEPVQGKFFEKYTTHGKKDGTGLGAYSARLMARTMGGEVEMETSQSNGTTLLIRLSHGGEKEIGTNRADALGHAGGISLNYSL